ncbi:LVIVD repeat-containing protein [Natronorubrum sp. DTA7]|uniref:LVIVD repeat-containing protein n=1 Tax=Natronorubrum sp. DTA7 TaxID=3447016 RepID=UPI003F826F7D
MQRRELLRTSGAVGVTAALSEAVLTATTRATAAAAESAPDDYEPLGRVEVTGAAEAVVGDDGETAYLATTDGFATVDISDPSEPELLADRFPLEVDDTPFREILDVKVDGDRLVVAGPANPHGDDVFHGFELYDVSDPADPVPVGEPYETGSHIHNCFLSDGVLYVVANGESENPLVIFDVSDDDVEEIGRWSLVDHEPEWEEVYWFARYNHDVYVRDEIAYLAHWNAGTYLIDVSDPTEPEYVSRVMNTDLEESLALDDDEAQMGLPGNDHYSAVDDTGDLLAVGREAWATGGDEPDGPGGIDLYDVSDPTEPEELASIDAPPTEDASYYGEEWTTAHNFELRDDRLYSSWYQGGVKIHDVSDPTEPEELAHWRDTDAAGFWTARVADPGETFVASSTPLIPGAETEGALYTFPTDLEPDSRASDGPLDSIPGFTGAAGVAGVAGGAVALEWLRRRDGADR